MIDVLGDAYSFFNKHRHTLFHMEAMPAGSRMISDFKQLLALSDSAYELLKRLYA
ncbi:mRNA endoribonuclease LS [compost metagenome]